MLDRIAALCAPHALCVLGACTDGPLPDGVQTLVLLGPSAAFWPQFTTSVEYADHAPDPMDRWSRRVIDGLAQDLGAQPFYPFGTAPPHPFYRWALATGRVWSSPVRLLVHDEAGLWVSFRGALGLSERLTLPPAPANPCTDCAQPCLTACPAGALGAQGYDVPRCHDWLDQPDGQSCMTSGCAVRAACPLSQNHGRVAEHTAYHMRQFHK